MALTVKVQNDAYPADTTFEIVGLGEFTNGEEREVSEGQEKVFVSMNQMPVEEKVGEDANVSISGSTSIENIDEVLGVDISDTVPAPTFEEEEEEAPAEAPTQVMPTQQPSDEGGGS